MSESEHATKHPSVIPLPELLGKMRNHILQMAPHQKRRTQGALFIEAYWALRTLVEAKDK